MDTAVITAVNAVAAETRAGVRDTLARLVGGSRPSKDTWPELPRVLHVTRVGLGLAVGLACGALGFTGWSGFMLYALVALGGVRWVCASFLEVDEESYGGASLQLEGLQPGLAVCLLAWTLLYQVTMRPL